MFSNNDFRKAAEEAYNAYAKEANWKNYQGLPMPHWLQLPDHIQRSWIAAVTAGSDYLGYSRESCCNCSEQFLPGEVVYCAACMEFTQSLVAECEC